MTIAHAALLRLVPVRPDTMEQDSQEDVPYDSLREVLRLQTTAQSMRFDFFESFEVVIVFDERPSRRTVFLVKCEASVYVFSLIVIFFPRRSRWSYQPPWVNRSRGA